MKEALIRNAMYKQILELMKLEQTPEVIEKINACYIVAEEMG